MKFALGGFLSRILRRKAPTSSGVGGISTAAKASRFDVVPSVPAGRRIYAIGDIHGRIDLLNRMLDLITTDLAKEADTQSKIVFLGDYIDRGMDSNEVIDCLLDWQGGDEIIYLRGNHEDMLLRFFDDASVLESWRHHGGLELLHSYKVPTKAVRTGNGYQDAQSSLKSNMPARHLDFLNSTTTCHMDGDFFFCHAGVDPHMRLDQQSPDDLLWIRERFTDYAGPLEKFVIHGHTPVAEPDVRSNRINVDTGAYATGILSCLVLENQSHRFLST